MNIMKIGTKSLLFGVHNFFIHPMYVTRAFVHYFKRYPNRYELLAIFVHDWGYWGCENMDGETGKRHPELGAKIMQRFNGRLGINWHDYTLYHSRAYAKMKGTTISPLCIADKLSHLFYPNWLYILLGTLSGEIWEYMRNTHDATISGGYVDKYKFIRDYKKVLRVWIAAKDEEYQIETHFTR